MPGAADGWPGLRRLLGSYFSPPARGAWPASTPDGAIASLGRLIGGRAICGARRYGSPRILSSRFAAKFADRDAANEILRPHRQTLAVHVGGLGLRGKNF